METSFQSQRLVVLRDRPLSLGRTVHFRCRKGLCRNNERAQANEYGSQNLVPPDRGQGRGPRPGPLVSLVRGTLADEAQAPATELTLP
jgi:hypothetical protein